MILRDIVKWYYTDMKWRASLPQNFVVSHTDLNASCLMIKWVIIYDTNSCTTYLLYSICLDLCYRVDAFLYQQFSGKHLNSSSSTDDVNATFSSHSTPVSFSMFIICGFSGEACTQYIASHAFFSHSTESQTKMEMGPTLKCISQQKE